jgi:6-phosphogluconate dehydrogenase
LFVRFLDHNYPKIFYIGEYIMSKSSIGLIGAGVMGQSLALNMERNGFSVAVFDADQDKVEEYLNTKAKGKNISAAADISALMQALEKPRRVLMMVPAGQAVDDLIETLLPHMEPGDILIDGGNTHYDDTTRRTRYLESKNFLYIGTGVSGGEEGALWGPAIMPGGSPEAWPHVQPILQKISARVDGEVPCCDWVGREGAGHFVKMVHNGIEYGDMQMICEAYFLMSNVLLMNADEMAATFEEWNKGELDSYLIDITAKIFRANDPDTGKPMVDVILDTAGQKGTGKWTSVSALDLGVPAPTIAEAVFARCISALKGERVAAEKVLAGPEGEFEGDHDAFKDAIKDALYASKICAYAQGFALMSAANKEWGWDLNLGRISLLWREGCIIRARFLEKIKDAYDNNAELANLMLDPYFKEAIVSRQTAWREVVASAVKLGCPVPAFSSALSYYDSYRNSRLPANLLQAQRDFFGAHTYKRVDREGIFHSEWLVTDGDS